MIDSLIPALLWWPVLTYVAGVTFVLVTGVPLWRNDEMVDLKQIIRVAVIWPLLIPRLRQ